MTQPITLNCPTCGDQLEWSEAYAFRPFCSERCKLIDLGEWASEGHAIPGEPAVVMDENGEFDPYRNH